MCFEVAGYSSDLLCEALRRNGDAVVGYSIVGSRKVVRLAITNGAMTEQDIDAFFTRLKAVRSEETAGENSVTAIAC